MECEADDHISLEIKKNWYDRLIISPKNSPMKRYFDLLVLLLVGYSCITSLYYVAFAHSHNIFGYIVELFFVIDLVLNFFTEHINEDTHEPVRQFKVIAL